MENENQAKFIEKLKDEAPELLQKVEELYWNTAAFDLDDGGEIKWRLGDVLSHLEMIGKISREL